MSQADRPAFRLGFKALADEIPDIVGQPLENERWDGAGDEIQATLMSNGAKGLMVWRKSDNWTAFTDGCRTWINGPLGLQERLNSERFDWELGIVVTDIIDQLPIAPWNQLDTRAISDIKMLVGHWDGGARIPDGYDPLSYYKSEAFYHIAKNWAEEGEPPAYGYGLMYCEVISRDGRVWITRPPEHATWSQMGANKIGYAIKVDATKGQDPTPAQLRSFKARLDFNCQRFNVPHNQVFGHGELTQYGNQTDCPGSVMLGAIQEYRKS